VKKIRRFKCGSCQKEYERLVKDGVKVVECECGKGATRMLAAPKCFNNSATCEGRSPSC